MMTVAAPDAGEQRRHRRAARRLARAAARDLMPPPAANFAAFGRSVIRPPCRITNPARVTIGDDVTILENVWMSVVEPFAGVIPRVVIGDGVRMGRGCGFAVTLEVVIERGATIGDFTMLADTFHPFELEDRLPVVVPGEPVRIGAGAILGSHVIVLPGVSIGAGARVEHHAVVATNVPDGTYFAGHPAWRSRRPRA